MRALEVHGIIDLCSLVCLGHVPVLLLLYTTAEIGLEIDNSRYIVKDG